jgi:hypothetical protein
MPFTVDQDRMKASRPFLRDGVEVKPLLQMDAGAPPVLAIPHQEFPRVVYKHPNEPFVEIEHRNDKFELVGTELQQTEHLTKLVNNEVELQAALDDGWVKEPYLPQALPDPRAGLYGKKRKRSEL